MTEYGPSAPQPLSGPPPGWYLDPGGMQVLRWWDGIRWGPQTQPLPPAAPAREEGTGRHRGTSVADDARVPRPAYGQPVPPFSAPVADSISAPRTRAPAPWAWVVAATPLVAIAIAAVARTNVAAQDDANCVSAGWVIANIIGLMAAEQDARALVKRGEIGGTKRAWLGLLGGWPYLWARAVKRTGRTNGDWWLFAAGAAIWVAAVVVSVPLSSGPPPQVTVNGTVEVSDDPAAGEYPPVDVGSQVTVTDPSGKVIGFTTLNGNAAQGPTFTLTFGFTAKVPEGESSYGISVSGLQGTTRFTQQQMQQGPAICAGDACDAA